MDVNNTEALRRWLMACPVILESGGIFGADYLQDAPGGWTLDNVPSALRYRENILGEVALQADQAQAFRLAARMPYGDDPRQNLENLGVLRDVCAWIAGESAAGRFPEWDGGDVTAVIPTLTPHAAATGTAWARYEVGIEVRYRV